MNLLASYTLINRLKNLSILRGVLSLKILLLLKKTNRVYECVFLFLFFIYRWNNFVLFDNVYQSVNRVLKIYSELFCMLLVENCVGFKWRL